MLNLQVSSQRLGLLLKPIELLPNPYRFQNVGIYTGCPPRIEN